jgi:hypothetical protein
VDDDRNFTIAEKRHVRVEDDGELVYESVGIVRVPHTAEGQPD